MPDSSTSASSSASSSAVPDATVSQDDAAAALKAYQAENNAANAALDTTAIAKAESGSLLALDQCNMVYDQGAGGTRAKQDEAAIALNNAAFYPVRATDYPRAFFATATGVQSGQPNSSVLIHFIQDKSGAPWLVDFDVALTSGQQWPAFAVDSSGALDYTATHLDQLALSTVDLAAADRTVLADNNAGQPGSPFLSDDATNAEQKWITNEGSSEAGATSSLTVTTDLNPAPTYIPLKDGGELALYGTRTAVRTAESGHTFTFGDRGWAKVAGADSVVGGFTAEAVWMNAAIDPADRAAKIQKIAYGGGLVSVHG
ncbi:hypothetical protein [Catenulispora sp. GAS73]|uniref:hypothetical protein n=1 Tax=Catenulispora sp. GAS73 TaxID=3156269 RepID=UPI0035182AC9